MKKAVFLIIIPASSSAKLGLSTNSIQTIFGLEKSLDFDRQKIIGNYIVDFYCAEKGVVIEVDGSSHNNKQDEDAKRDAYLRSLGLVVIRLLVKDVLRNMEGVVFYLKHHPALAGTPPEEGNKKQESDTLPGEASRVPPIPLLWRGGRRSLTGWSL